MNFESLSLKYDGKSLILIDQTQLPDEEVWTTITTPEVMYEFIKQLKVRGAPLIGVSAGLFLGLYAKSGVSREEFVKTCAYLRESRPTAVNLMYVIDKIKSLVAEKYEPNEVEKLAVEILNEDKALCERIANHGADLIEKNDNIITHCNTGGLATAGDGTALAVIKRAHEQGKNIHVYVDETRPLLQGGRLTTWELEKLKIPYTLICDNMASTLMRDGKIQKAIVGADRIARNGDFANKIGTYSLAIQCKYHDIPFYTAAPYTTVDSECETGADIEIELRPEQEVRGAKGCFGDVRWAPAAAATFNPAFDVTAAELVSAWVLDSGVFTEANFL